MSSAPAPAPRRPRAGGEAAFTMVEIALSLAVIGFALVAIIGVLPLGLEVQKENREETVINNDANYFMDAIRNGARGLDELTNHVTAITTYSQVYDADTNAVGAPARFEYDYSGTTVPAWPLDSGSNIVGLLSRPKYQPAGAGFRSNYVVAHVRSLSGPATEKFPQTDPTIQDLGFSYRLISEVVPVAAYDTNSAHARNLQANMHEVRLLFRWPLLPGGKTGNGRQVYRSLVGGVHINEPVRSPLWFFQPTIYTTVNATP
ncbi:MAG: hypothetical protein IH623_03095 [Verrucomicrobia bacterium]|nr:hypothetical protein [Verrucomicrobiota bacterium]